MLFRRLTVSVLFLTSLFAMAAVGQQPGQKQPLGEKVKPADPADAAVVAALANDPDVKIARAKMQLAEGELAKAKQGVVLRVLTLNATIKEYKAAVASAQDRVARTAQMVAQGTIDQGKLLDERAKLETAQAALARAETELKLLTGGGASKEMGIEFSDPNAAAVTLGLKWLGDHDMVLNDPAGARIQQFLALMQHARESQAVKGPIPDRIRAALDKTVKLGPKGEKISLEKALEIFKKEAGLDVPVRGAGDLVKSPVIVSQGEELPVGAWFQLYQDYTGGNVLYVREYGLLFTDKASAPPDAPTLTEFWKRKPEAKKEP